MKQYKITFIFDHSNEETAVKFFNELCAGGSAKLKKTGKYFKVIFWIKEYNDFSLGLSIQKYYGEYVEIAKWVEEKE